MSGPTSTTPPVVSAPTPGAARLLRRLARDGRWWFAATVFVAALLVSLFGSLLAPYPLGWADIDLSMGAPGDGHPLGLNRDGEDIMSLLIHATSNTLTGMLVTVTVAIVIGVASGLLAGFFPRTWFDAVASWVANLVLAIPAILVLVAVRGLIGPSMLVNMGIFGVLLSPVVFRIVRTSVSAVRNELYVDAARVNGLTTGVILGTHILGVVRGPIIIQGAFLAAAAVAIQAGLEFLGIGDANSTTWGAMLSAGFSEIYQQPMQMLWPAVAIGLFSGAAVLLGNALTDAFGRPEGRVPSRRRLERLAAELDTDQPDVRSAPAAPAIDAAISLRGLRVAYQTSRGISEVVHGVDLDLGRGRVLGLVGESGSGKTQTVLACLGLLPSGGFVAGGSIRIEGDEVGGLSRRARRRVLGVRVGYIPQEPLVNLDPLFTVGFHLVEPLVTRGGLTRAAAKQKSLALLARVGIRDPERVFRSYPHEISGGMAQRVLIAGAVSLDPDILIADEPTTALDVTVQAEVLDLLRDLQAERGMSVLLVTHNFGVVADLCDEVAVMRHGVLVEHGDVRTVLREPAHDYTRALLSALVEDKPSLVESDIAPAKGSHA